MCSFTVILKSNIYKIHKFVYIIGICHDDEDDDDDIEDDGSDYYSVHDVTISRIKTNFDYYTLQLSIIILYFFKKYHYKSIRL